MKAKRTLLPVLLLLLALAAAGLFVLRDAAMLYHGPVTEREQEYYVNKLSRRAFAGSWLWDGDPDHMTVTVPDKINGVAVTALGGYYGRGVPVRFGVTLPEAYRSTLEPSPDIPLAEELVFTVELGKSVTEIHAADTGYDTVAVGTGAAVARYHVSYRYVCDAENPVFYAEDGVLYRRDDGRPALS